MTNNTMELFPICNIVFIKFSCDKAEQWFIVRLTYSSTKDGEVDARSKYVLKKLFSNELISVELISSCQ